MSILQTIDKVSKGSKIFMTSASFGAINALLLAAFGLDLVPYTEQIGIVMGALNTLALAGINICRMAHDDIRIKMGNKS